MTFKEYQDKAVETAIYGAGNAIIYPALGLANEAGEVLGKIKKVLRDNNGDFHHLDTRMAIADEAPKNTASRMLSVIGKWVHNNFEEITTLISYQDTEAHHGTIYKASNWVAVNQSGKGVLWDNARKRNAAQSDASKVRWELKIR